MKGRVFPWRFSASIKDRQFLIITPLFGIRLAWGAMECDRPGIVEGWRLGLFPYSWDFMIEEGCMFYRYYLRDEIFTPRRELYERCR